MDFVEDVDDEEPPPQPAFDASNIEGIDDDDDEIIEVEDAANEMESGFHIDGLEEEEEGYGAGPSDSTAAAAASGPPRALKRWPLPPSLTPKKRHKSGTLAEVALDVNAEPAADGAWRCATCDTPYETRTGLFAHARFCAGRAAGWTCEWCQCTEAETHGKASGPNGIRTLCSTCGQRYRHGAESMPEQNEKGEWVCVGCQRAFSEIRALGSHRRFCDGGVWRCGWCECKSGETTNKGPGPDGPMTLCSACSNRFRAGHQGPPKRDEDGKYVCDGCAKRFETISGLGSHRKHCDGGNWRCKWCACGKDETMQKGPGPDGSGSLCSLCSARWRSGHAEPTPADANGRYPCDKCERTFETFRALGIHSRNCDGGNWRCNWCACTAVETSGKSPGPDGPRTLCSNCASRYRNGAKGPPVKNADGKYECEKCLRAFDNFSSIGGHLRFCDGGNWRCKWCACKRDECTGKGPGPDGGSSLCSICSMRWKAGHTGPAEADADGKYACDRCDRTFDTFRALGIHSRGCDGGNWRCNWCACKADECSGKSPGPDGKGTLCSNCGSRYRNGATGPPKVDALGMFPCDFCGRVFDSISGLGSHRRRCNMGK